MRVPSPIHSISLCTVATKLNICKSCNFPHLWPLFSPKMGFLRYWLSLKPIFGMKELRYAKIDTVYFERGESELSEYQIRFSLTITVFSLYSVENRSFLRILADFWVFCVQLTPLNVVKFYKTPVNDVSTLYLPCISIPSRYFILNTLNFSKKWRFLSIFFDHYPVFGHWRPDGVRFLKC